MHNPDGGIFFFFGDFQLCSSYFSSKVSLALQMGML
jgi:hypothetical protein